MNAYTKFDYEEHAETLRNISAHLKRLSYTTSPFSHMEMQYGSQCEELAKLFEKYIETCYKDRL